MTTTAELESKRRNTSEYIARDPAAKLLPLSREDLVWEGGSFNRANLQSLRAQRMLLLATNQQLPERRTVEGQTVTPEYVLLGSWDADIRNGDWFYVDGVKYEVVFVHPDRSYQTKAEVVYRG